MGEDNKTAVEVGIIDHDGNFMKLGESINIGLDLTEEKDIPKYIVLCQKSYEIGVDITSNSGLTAAELWLVLCGECTMEQVMQNNWRKLHGLPMKRRRIYGKKM